jgi:hypothetical protein
MLFLTLNLAAALMLTQAPPANFACSVLTPAQVTSLIGTAKTLPVTNAANGSTCMFQNNDKIVTVLVATNASAEGAKGLFGAKQRIVAGTEIAGWGVPAYSGSMKNAAACGVLKQQTFVEVKVSDSTQPPDAMVKKLQGVMREFAVRK